MEEFVLTHHLRQRFVQRTNKKYDHVQRCKNKQCLMCDSLLREIRIYANQHRRELDVTIREYLGQAVECRWCLNNSEFMSWYYDKYGYDKKFRFLVHNGILFVGVVDDGKCVLVTCVVAKTHIAGKQSLRPKFNKIKKKDDLGCLIVRN